MISFLSFYSVYIMWLVQNCNGLMLQNCVYVRYNSNPLYIIGLTCKLMLLAGTYCIHANLVAGTGLALDSVSCTAASYGIHTSNVTLGHTDFLSTLNLITQTHTKEFRILWL